jgi:hypothetical protein
MHDLCVRVLFSFEGNDAKDCRLQGHVLADDRRNQGARSWSNRAQSSEVRYRHSSRAIDILGGVVEIDCKGGIMLACCHLISNLR